MAIGFTFLLIGAVFLIFVVGALLAGAALVLRYWNERTHHKVEVVVGFTLLGVATFFSLPLIFGLVLLVGN